MSIQSTPLVDLYSQLRDLGHPPVVAMMTLLQVAVAVVVLAVVLTLSLEILPREVDVRLITGMDTIRHLGVPNPKKLVQL